MTVSERPPVGLSVNLRAPDGSTPYRWGYDEPVPEDRPQGLRFRTSRYNGFADGGCTLQRPAGREWPDLRLLGDVTFTGYDGSTAYEGMIHGRPRTTGEGGDRFQVGLVGWIAQTKRRRFSMVFIDRDLSRWGGPSQQRSINMANLGLTTTSGRVEIQSNATQGSAAIVLAFDRLNQPAGTNRANAEAWYDVGPGNLIQQFRADYESYDRGGGGTNTLNVNFANQIYLSSDPVATAFEGGGELGTNGTTSVTASGPRRYALAQFAFNANIGETDGDWRFILKNVRIIGNHGITLVSGTNAAVTEGVLASDVVRWLVDNHCPGLSASGVQATSAPIPHLAFYDRTWPYDAILTANKQDLYNFGVWENRTLHYAPGDLTDYDWQVRHGDPGVKINLQGDSTEQLLSGLEVQFTDSFTGAPALLLPANNPDLRDDRVENPFNQAGLPGEDTLVISQPITSEQALQAGARALAQRNQPRGIGTIEISGGHIRDRAGNWQPVWKVRADDRIAILNDDNPRPRVIAETDYSADDRRLQMSIEGSFRRVDAALAA